MPRPYNVEEEHFDGDDDDVSESADDGDDAFAAGVHLDVEEEELAAAAQGGPKKGRRAPINNEAALLLKLQQMGEPTPDDSDAAWLETLTVTAPEPLELDDAEDDTKRELAFHKLALASVRSAQERLRRLGVAYTRPDDYLAEMLKPDAHMVKVKRRLVQQQEAIVQADERRKQRDRKKFGKQQQTEKLQARVREKKADIARVTQQRKAGGRKQQYVVDGC